jgi:hypothetical protein
MGKQTDERIESVFYTTYKGKRLRLYKRTYKAYRNEITSAPYMADEVILEIVADNGLTLWTFPKVDITRDLLEAVQYEVSSANDLLVELLKHHPTNFKVLSFKKKLLLSKHQLCGIRFPRHAPLGGLQKQIILTYRICSLERSNSFFYY